LEELIPASVRQRFNITTSTPMEADLGARDAGAAMRELHPVNHVHVVYNDKWMRHFMRQHDITTARRADDNLARIREWAFTNGCIVALVPDSAAAAAAAATATTAGTLNN
jgi:hypothetical protein